MNRLKWNKPDIKKTNTKWFHLYKVLRIGKFIKIGSRLGVEGFGEGGVRSYYLTPIEFWFGVMESFGNSGDSCITLYYN